MLITLLFTITSARRATDVASDFVSFVNTYQRPYATDITEFSRRFQIYADNVNRVENHNSNNRPWKMALNQYADITHDEFIQQHVGLRARAFTPNTRTDSCNTCRSSIQFIKHTIDATGATISDLAVLVKEFCNGLDTSSKEFCALVVDNIDEIVKLIDDGIEYADICNTIGLCSKLTMGDVPSSVDWRTKGAVTPVKDQGQCGSCWSFSATGAVEGAHFVSTGQLVSVSEQQLVDCAGTEGNYGCNGGWMDSAFQYLLDNKGLCSESDYPYTAHDDQCRASACHNSVLITGYVDVQVDSEEALKRAVSTQPVSVAVDADQFQFYHSGILDGECGTRLDHGVLAVGYGTSERGEDYWIIKNSWGSNWGENGYIRLLRKAGEGTGQCGIDMAASYPIASRAIVEYAFE